MSRCRRSEKICRNQALVRKTILEWRVRTCIPALRRRRDAAVREAVRHRVHDRGKHKQRGGEVHDVPRLEHLSRRQQGAQIKEAGHRRLEAPGIVLEGSEVRRVVKRPDTNVKRRFIS